MFRYLDIAKSFGAPLSSPRRTGYSAYPVVIAPAYELIRRGLVKKWTRYVEQGGNLILTARTGQKDATVICGSQMAEPIYSLIGSEIPSDLLLDDGKGEVKMGSPLILGTSGQMY